MGKVISALDAAGLIFDGAVVMFGGFMANGSAHGIIDALVARGVRDLTIICNDSGYVDKGVGLLIVNGQCKKLITSHIGLNKETGRLMNEGKIEVVLTPQGTLAEQIRAGGYGLGGVLTRTGLGTLVAEGKQTVDVDGVTYLLEKPLRADFAILHGSVVDENGNITYKGSTNNFNNVMAAAADVTIVEAEVLVENGGIDPNHVTTPGVFVKHIVKGGKA
ncbi:MAG: CoA transferase subunit A [Defluviitaleaceae bacterium]|nr:CoA transferase subunit A [Defluviitaleaceae bacterium]